MYRLVCKANVERASRVQKKTAAFLTSEQSDKERSDAPRQRHHHDGELFLSLCFLRSLLSNPKDNDKTPTDSVKTNKQRVEESVAQESNRSKETDTAHAPRIESIASAASHGQQQNPERPGRDDGRLLRRATANAGVRLGERNPRGDGAAGRGIEAVRAAKYAPGRRGHGRTAVDDLPQTPRGTFVFSGIIA